jgi:hypothetical protein
LWFVGFRPDAYISIKTLPLSEWWAIHETGNISLLLPNNKFTLTKELFDYCSSVWDNIRQEHLDVFGVPSEYKEYLRLTADLAIAKMTHALSNNNFDLMLIRIAEDDLEKITGRPTQSNLKTKGNIERVLDLRFPIDPKTTTVEEYYTYLESAQQTNK